MVQLEILGLLGPTFFIIEVWSRQKWEMYLETLIIVEVQVVPAGGVGVTV